jgi:hypothetical protein
MSEWRQWWSGINRTVRACEILSPRYFTEQFERFVSSVLRRGVAFLAGFLVVGGTDPDTLAAAPARDQRLSRLRSRQ